MRHPLCIAAALLTTLWPIPSTLGRAFVVPHILETSGRITDTPFAVDTTFFLTYNATLLGNDNGFAQVELYLYDDKTGELMLGAAGTPIAGPGTYRLDAQQRKISIRIDDLIAAQRGFDTKTKRGFAVVVVSGPQEDAVNLQVITVNSHSGASDLAVFGFEPQPLPAAAPPSGQTNSARAFVIPHVLETSGTTADTTNALDTLLYAVYAGGLPGANNESAAALEFYLYDEATGKPMVSAGGAEVCNPCSYSLGSGGAGAAARKVSIRVDDLITAAGGFDAEVKRGYGVVVVSGADPAEVALEGFIVNSHTGPFDLSVATFIPQAAKGPNHSQAKSFVVPHVLERRGSASAEPYTLDTTLVATYTAGLAGIEEGQGATLDLYLYDNAGRLLQGSTGSPVCGPCTFALGLSGAESTAPRKRTIVFDDLLAAANGFDSDMKLGFAVVVLGGADPDGVNLQGFVVNSHTSPFDLSVFGFEPQEVKAARLSGGSGASDPPAKAFVLPHVLERSGTIAETPFTIDTVLYATYVGNLPGTGAGEGATLKLYLFDSATGSPLSGATGEVCNPCLFALSNAAPKLSVTMDDLITARAGGFGGAVAKSGFGLVLLDGDVANVNLEAFVVNSHTGPFDLSVFGFEPQPIVAARLAPMPVQVKYGTEGLELSIPTVIGGRYTVEGKTELEAPDWTELEVFEGDGAVQRRTIPGFQSARQFLRVRGS